LVAGCAPQPDVTAKDSDNGRQIQLHSGQLFDIVLADDYKTSKCQWRDNQHYDAGPRLSPVHARCDCALGDLRQAF
jgi:hypothetical protein